MPAAQRLQAEPSPPQQHVDGPLQAAGVPASPGPLHQVRPVPREPKIRIGGNVQLQHRPGVQGMLQEPGGQPAHREVSEIAGGGRRTGAGTLGEED